jgi:hypothetical protein
MANQVPQRIDRAVWKDIIAVLVIVAGLTILTTGAAIALGIGWALVILGSAVLTVGLIMALTN